MSLLTIVQDAAREVGIGSPATVIGNSDPDVAKLLRFTFKVGYDLMKSYDWPALQQGITATTTDINDTNLASYISTNGGGIVFDRFVPNTMWDTTNDRFVAGPIHIAEQRGLANISNNRAGAPEKFTVRGGSVFFFPVPTGYSASVEFQIIRGDWINNTDVVFGADSDTVRFDEELMKRGVVREFLEANGLPWQRAAMQFDDLFKRLTNNEYPGRGTMVAGDLWGSGGRHYSGQPPVSDFNGLF